MGLENSNFIKACYGRNEGRIPLWIMRQAGRYLPEYRAIRKEVAFHKLCHTPKLAAEVVRQPIERFGFDAAILFSDILTILEPMGMVFDFTEGGPQIDTPLSGPDDIQRLSDFDIENKLSFVFDSIREIRKTLPNTPLIGFAGSPFTLACYLIEGKGSKTFDRPKQFLHKYPQAAREMIDLLTDVIARCLQAQIDAGVDAVQIFDSWGGVLSQEDYAEWSARPIEEIFARLKSRRVPRILFVNNTAPYLDIVRDIHCEVIGVDYRMDLATAAAALNGKAVQGNLDPSVLFESPDHVAERTRRILGSVNDHRRLIFNLGHGIHEDTPLESVQAVVDTVHSFRS